MGPNDNGGWPIVVVLCEANSLAFSVPEYGDSEKAASVFKIKRILRLTRGKQEGQGYDPCPFDQKDLNLKWLLGDFSLEECQP
jgi:hypothetical protein